MRKKAIAGQETISISHTHTCCRHCRPLLLSHRSEIETDYSSKFQRIGFVVTRSKLEQFFFFVQMICIVEIESFASLLTQFGANVCTYNFQLHFFFVSLSLSAVVRAVIVCRKQISGWKWGNDKETFFSLVVICDAFYG